jgi:hypothetical protein
MDFLLEMTPGAGWLARENNRVVWLPNDVPVETAHDVIEPLLVPRDLETSVRTLATWIESGRPLPETLLIGLDGSPHVMGHGSCTIVVVDADATNEREMTVNTAALSAPLGNISSMAVNDTRGLASGMLVEGVVRAGGFRIHIHTALAALPIDPMTRTIGMNDLQVEIDGFHMDIGGGLVLGRWPYKHPTFDSSREALILADPAVSRLHAEVTNHKGAPVVVDRDSHNGTWVVVAATGQRVRLAPNEPYPLKPGDQIALGDSVVRIVLPND